MEVLMTIEEVAAFLSLSRDTVYRMVQSGKLPASKVGNQWRFKREELHQWLELNKNTPKPSSTKKSRNAGR